MGLVGVVVALAEEKFPADEILSGVPPDLADGLLDFPQKGRDVLGLLGGGKGGEPAGEQDWEEDRESRRPGGAFGPLSSFPG